VVLAIINIILSTFKMFMMMMMMMSKGIKVSDSEKVTWRALQNHGRSSLKDAFLDDCRKLVLMVQTWCDMVVFSRHEQCRHPYTTDDY